MQGVSSSITCAHVPGRTYDSIWIRDMFAEGRAAGDTFQFYVARMRNPVSLEPVRLELMTFAEINEVNSDGSFFYSGRID